MWEFVSSFKGIKVCKLSKVLVHFWYLFSESTWYILDWYTGYWIEIFGCEIMGLYVDLCWDGVGVVTMGRTWMKEPQTCVKLDRCIDKVWQSRWSNLRHVLVHWQSVANCMKESQTCVGALTKCGKMYEGIPDLWWCIDKVWQNVWRNLRPVMVHWQSVARWIKGNPSSVLVYWPSMARWMKQSQHCCETPHLR